MHVIRMDECAAVFFACFDSVQRVRIVFSEHKRPVLEALKDIYDALTVNIEHLLVRNRILNDLQCSMTMRGKDRHSTLFEHAAYLRKPQGGVFLREVGKYRQAVNKIEHFVGIGERWKRMTLRR